MFEDVEPNSERWLNLEDLPNEIWKDIKGYEGLYQVSNYGRVKSFTRNTIRTHILKCNVKKNGYIYITLYNNGYKYYRLHRLVAETFIPNPNNYPCINHKDENKQNNKIDNLEWCTWKYNANYGTRNQRVINKHIKKVCQYDLNENCIKIWDSLSSIGEELGYCISHISQCCNGKRYTAHKYIWKYMEDDNGMEI